MSTGHEERLLLAGTDYDAALAYRDVAKASMEIWQRQAERFIDERAEVPPHTIRRLESAKLEYLQLNRICARHEAKRLDEVLRARGEVSNEESAVIFFDVTNPL